MSLKELYITLVVTLLSAITVSAQESHTEIFVDFRVNSTVIDPKYSDNARQIQEIIDFLHRVEQDSTVSFVSISFCGSASPEGSYQLNHRLARRRLEALEKEVRSKVVIPDSIISRDDEYIPWDYLKEQVRNSDIANKQAILDILNQEPTLVDYPGGRHIDSRITMLQKMDGGVTWRKLHKLYFEQMRNACVVFVTLKREIPVEEPVVAEPVVEEIVEVPVVADTVVAEPVVEPEYWTRHLYVKTNAIGLGFGIANLGVEVDLAEHWSFNLPIYYSAWNYFKYANKFRTFALQPEVRYWLKNENQGFFAGAHFTYAQYNIGLTGNDYRYQDHSGKSPALGGGISLGYRLPISKNNKWHIEFVVGGGVYTLHYDKFYNVPDGKLVETCRDTYWGLDNAAINISYRFDLDKRKK